MSKLSIPRAVATTASSSPSPATWISVADTAALLKIRPATVIGRVEKGKLEGKTPEDMPFTYDGKPNYVIRLECLPQKLQYKYIVNHLPEDQLCSVDLASPRSKLGNIWIDQFVNAASIIRDATIIKTRYHSSKDVTKHLQKLANANNISLATLYRYLDQPSAKETSLLYVDPVYREGVVPTTMCMWSCDLALALHLDSDNYYSQNAIYFELEKRRDNVSCSSCPYHPDAKALSSTWKVPSCPCAGEYMKVPNHRKTVNRFLSHVPEQLICYAREGVREWKSQYGYFAKRERPLLVGECFEGDHHKFDLFVRIPVQKTVNGKTYEKEIAVRPTLTAWMDSATGCIVGWVISVMPNSDTIAEAFCRAVVPTPGVPFRGIPRAVYVDCGKDYKSQLLEDMPDVFTTDNLPDTTMLNRRFSRVGLLQSLGVETIQHALPYHPQSKGGIERVFGTIERGWICKITGWCRNSVSERPYDFQKKLSQWLENKELLTLEEFSAYFQNTILPEYHGQIDEEKSLPELPGWELSGASLSPIQLYAKLPKVSTVIPDWRTISILKMHMKADLKVYKQGIRFGNSYYQADELACHVGNKVDVLYHKVQPPYLPSSLTVILRSTHPGEQSVFEAYPAQQFQMVGESPIAVSLHSDVQKAAEKEYGNALRHIRMAAKGILPDKPQSTDRARLYDETYAPATMEEIETTSPQDVMPAEEPSVSADFISKGLQILFGEE